MHVKVSHVTLGGLVGYASISYRVFQHKICRGTTLALGYGLAQLT